MDKAVSRSLKSQVVLIFHLFPGMPSLGIFLGGFGAEQATQLVLIVPVNKDAMDHNDNS